MQFIIYKWQKNDHLLVRKTHKVLMCEKRIKASVAEQQLQQWGWKLAPKLNSEGISSWDQLARSNGFETIYNSSWVKHPLEIENQKLFRVEPKLLKKLRPWKTKRSVQKVVAKHQLDSTRVTALVGKEPCFTAKSWSFSLSEITELIVPDCFLPEKIPTETGHGSCLATLFFKVNLDTLKVCDTEQIQLPSTEKAENLGFEVWLITSATSAYTLFQPDIESTTASGKEKFPGCHICIVTLGCEKS